MTSKLTGGYVRPSGEYIVGYDLHSCICGPPCLDVHMRDPDTDAEYTLALALPVTDEDLRALVMDVMEKLPPHVRKHLTKLERGV